MSTILAFRAPVFGKGNRLQVSRLLHEKLCRYTGAPCEYIKVQRKHPDLHFQPEDILRLNTVASDFGSAFVFNLNDIQVHKPIRIESDQMFLSWRPTSDYGPVMDLVIPTEAVMEISAVLPEGRERCVMPNYSGVGTLQGAAPLQQAPRDQSKEGRLAHAARNLRSANGGVPDLRVVSVRTER